jgi:REP element-mobilizing transposase RayT
MKTSLPYPDRTSPNHSPHPRDEYDIIFITVCAKNRAPIFGNEQSHQTLVNLWRNKRHWMVGRYVLMPDHIHLFARRAELGTVSLRQWVGWWKRNFSFELQLGSGLWQQDFWDTRMRSEEHYNRKWFYVRDNPVRQGLTSAPDDWHYQGEIYILTA